MNEPMSISRCLFMYALLSFLLGCAANYPPIENTPIESAPTEGAQMGSRVPTGGAQMGSGVGVPIPARDILYPDKTAPSGYGAYGYLIFTRRASEKEMERYKSICKAYIRNLEPVFQHNQPKKMLMPTYWLAKREKKEAGLDRSEPDCLSMVNSYDYAEAKKYASAVSALNSRGPLLVAWSTQFENVSNGEKALILDLSDFLDEDLDRAFGIWMKQITCDPRIWHAGWNIVLAREAFRSYLEKYGDNIVAAVSTIKKTVIGKGLSSAVILTMSTDASPTVVLAGMGAGAFPSGSLGTRRNKETVEGGGSL